MEIVIKAPEDFNKVCRSCLTVTTADKDLFDYHLIEDNQLTNISTIFESLTSLKVTVGDGLPESICFVCYKSLVQAEIYRNRCLESEKQLKLIKETFVSDSSTEGIKNVDTSLIDVIKTNFKSNILHKLLHFVKAEQTDTDIALCKPDLKRELSSQNKITLIDNNANPTLSSSEKPKIKRRKVIIRRIKPSEKQLHKFSDRKTDTDIALCEPDLKRELSSQNKITLIDNNANPTLSSCEKPKIKRRKVIIRRNKPSEKQLHKFSDRKTDTDIALCEPNLKHELSSQNKITLIDNNANPTLSSSEKPKIKRRKVIIRRIKPSEKQLHKFSDRKISKSCSLCDKVFSDACALSLHYLKHALIMQNVENVTSGYLFCEVCGQLFDCNSNLDQHYDGKHNGKIYWTCTECLSEFSTEMELLKHNLLHHSSTYGATGTNFLCRLCHKRFSSEEDLLKHGFTHLVLKYNCKKCQISFCTQETYNSHSKLIHGSKYICRICGETFKNRNYLKCHKKYAFFKKDGSNCIPAEHNVYHEVLKFK